MKSIITCFVATFLCVCVSAQKRNMIPNGDFETIHGDQVAQWSIGSGMRFNSVDDADAVIRGTHSLHIEGQMVRGNSLLISDRIFTVSRGETYELRFKAVCTGTEDAVVEPYLECQYSNAHFPGENLFESKTITIPCDGVVREYTLETVSLHVFGTGNTICTYTVFLLNFLSMQGLDSYLIVDDIEIVRTDPYGDVVGNIKTNPEFLDNLNTYWLYSEQGYFLSNVTVNQKSSVRISMYPIGTAAKRGYSCFTGSSTFWKEHENSNWEIRITMESDFTNSDAKLFINGDEKVFKYLVPPGSEGEGGYECEIKEGLHTYTFDYLPKEKGGALQEGMASGDLLFDLYFGNPDRGVVYIHSFYMVEKTDVASLSVVMPEKVEIGRSVPVGIWANPTHANNQVTLAVSNLNGAVQRNENGEWIYTQLKEGECTVQAVSQENPLVVARWTVDPLLTSTPFVSSDAMDYYVDKASGQLILRGLQGGETIELIDTGGQVIRAVQDRSSISISGLKKGVYLLRISRNGQTIVKKIMN